MSVRLSYVYSNIKDGMTVVLLSGEYSNMSMMRGEMKRILCVCLTCIAVFWEKKLSLSICLSQLESNMSGKMNRRFPSV